jgi:hypothetical protein
VWSYSYGIKTKSEPKTSLETKDAREIGNVDDPFVFDGPRVTIAATIPKKLEKVVRAMVGSRGFSKVVAEALAREVVRVHRDEFVRTMEAENGPADYVHDDPSSEPKVDVTIVSI